MLNIFSDPQLFLEAVNLCLAVIGGGITMEFFRRNRKSLNNGAILIIYSFFLLFAFETIEVYDLINNADNSFLKLGIKLFMLAFIIAGVLLETKAMWVEPYDIVVEKQANAGRI